MVIASLALPSFARVMPVGVNPADYIKDVVLTGDTKTVVYDFNGASVPRIRFTDNLGGSEEFVSQTLPVHYDVNPESKINHIWIYPFGLRYTENQDIVSSHGFIDVSEIMPGATFTFTSRWNLEVDMQSWDTNDCEIGMALYYHSYDAEGKYLETVKTSTSWSDMEVVDTGDYYVLRSVYEAHFGIEVKPNVHYICPYMTATILTSTEMLGSSQITVWDASFGGSVDVNMIYEQSTQMNVIKNKLDGISNQVGQTNDKLDGVTDKIQDTNDKLDDLIQGTPEQNEVADNAVNDTQQSISDFNSIIEKLEDYETIDVDWSAEHLKNFFDSAGYRQVEDLIEPLLHWEWFGTILLVILSLSNLSLIFFGR